VLSARADWLTHTSENHQAMLGDGHDPPVPDWPSGFSVNPTWHVWHNTNLARVAKLGSKTNTPKPLFASRRDATYKGSMSTGIAIICIVTNIAIPLDIKGLRKG